MFAGGALVCYLMVSIAYSLPMNFFALVEQMGSRFFKFDGKSDFF